jgi:hypothetical protein
MDSSEPELEEIVAYSVPQAQGSFLYDAYPQVARLLVIHKTLGGAGPGRRHNLEVLNKSAIVLTCAFWEAFVEDLTAEALKHLAQHSKASQSLPIELRKSIAKELAHKKHELAPWDLADDEWRKVLQERAEKIVSITDRTLSSPTSNRVDEFFMTQAGMAHVSDAWRWSGTSASQARRKLDDFVSLRNAIAHRGGPGNAAVLKKDAERGLRLVYGLTEASLKVIDKQLASATGVPLIEVSRFSPLTSPSEDAS